MSFVGKDCDTVGSDARANRGGHINYLLSLLLMSNSPSPHLSSTLFLKCS